MQLSELKEIIQKEIENRLGAPRKSMLLEAPDFSSQTYRGINFEIPSVDSHGNILSEDTKHSYVSEMRGLLDSFLNNPNKKQ